ncbi:MAG TPA: DNA polymerase III subunit gamma/tau [Candidatus Babeliales bacterium]|nr:DNA polymerase III subunit gamma/tau [Candidatus Babeliales bacterium]
MSSVVLNLSRKWRSQDFDHIVGQDLAVRILKNSLYLGHYFPVYLCAGQRGCGKTSTARVFAAAVNCHALPLFQKDPKKHSIPCLACVSCVAMKEGNHPDFVEIDAASHTGVDNIRAVIESSSLLPIMGRKRVYLIDEAHMLSKAAFNAALKILEEPPATALFILATTNPHKIIDTVRSRCFQLFFTPIPHEILKNHLIFICKQEKIAHTDEALDLIVRHTEGSARDALNLLEQIRFSNAVVNKEAVLALLGHIDDQQIMNLIQLTMQGEAQNLVKLLHSLAIDKHKAEFIWQRMVILLRALLWMKYDVQPHELIASAKLLESTARYCTLHDLHRMIEVLYTHEEVFLKTTLQHVFLEIILLSLCAQDAKKNNNNDGSAPCTLAIANADAEEVDDECEEQEDNDIQEDEAMDYDQKWLKFIAKVASLNEPLVHSVFKQARFIAYVPENHRLSVELSKDFVLFKEWLDSTQSLWQPLLRDLFSANVLLDTQFTGTYKAEIQTKKIKSEETVAAKPVAKQFTPSSANGARHSPNGSGFHASPRYNNQKTTVASVHKNNESRIDVSDENKWKTAAMVMRHFPGTVTEIRENQ